MRYICSFLILIYSLTAQEVKRSALDTDPEVVYLSDYPHLNVELGVKSNATVFSDKNGVHKIGVLLADQKVKVDAITDRACRVKGKGVRDGISGWVGLKFFSSKDEKFEEHLKHFYQRQMELAKIMSAHQVAIGMTMEEVIKSLGKPTKTNVRQTAEGQSGKWEYVKMEEEKNYRYIQNPVTGQMYRQLISVTQVEKGKRVIEFSNNLVNAIEDSEDHGSGTVRTIFPPIVIAW